MLDYQFSMVWSFYFFFFKNELVDNSIAYIHLYYSMYKVFWLSICFHTFFTRFKLWVILQGANIFFYNIIYNHYIFLDHYLNSGLARWDGNPVRENIELFYFVFDWWCQKYEWNKKLNFHFTLFMYIYMCMSKLKNIS